ncbi:Inner membrane protein YfdC [Sphingomonas sp. EC-HK361]|uniref:formate/nitrite transporter family protein n=1 Tax=Sphingomonas sp. EC-HK361 TaxID=2038397 RepID=UPI001254CDC3|nr:formate/nitrite transporter family protein [Sphingomonas sp. EC-HK361]VVT13179.1 Inner membrane protein YfdC [Sphingomonas sp. EC-HK361]
MTNKRDQDATEPEGEGQAETAVEAKELHRAVRAEGEAELDRPAASLFWSAFAGGLAITATLLAQGAIHGALPDAPWRDVVVALGYPIGFVIVILGRMQLFTESTVTAMLPLVTKPSLWALRRTLRLWGIVIGANLLGTFVAAAAIASGFLGADPGLRDAMTAVSMKVVELPPAMVFVNAIPAGMLIAVVAWVLPSAREQSVLVIFVIGFVVAAGHFSHSIVGSVEAFLLLLSGVAGAGPTLLGFLLPALLGNLIGGAGLFALLAHAQVKGEMAETKAAE